MQAIRSMFARTIGLPIKSIVKREAMRRILRELAETQWLSPEAIHELRSKRLRHLMVEIARDVPYYREQIRALGANPAKDDPWEILRRLPTLDKKAYRDLGSALCSERARSTPVVAHTSGTTGERLEVRIDRKAAGYRYLAGFRGRQWWGIEPGDPEFRIWGSGIRTARTRTEYLKKVAGLIKEWSVGVTMVSPFFRTDEDLKRAAALLFRRKPKFVFGYANSVYLLASYMRRNGLKAGPGWPLAVGYTSEALLDSQRDEMAKAFDAPVVAEYGSCESGVVAYMCPEGSLHTSDDIMVVEILDEGLNRQDGLGEIVVTQLLCTEFPLIRYRQGDLARLDDRPCRCGRGLRTLSSLMGRMNDCFVSASGGIVDFIVFDQAMKDHPAIRRFKVIERGPGDFVFLGELHAGERWSDADRDRFMTQCLELLPPDVRLAVRSVDHLPSEPSGKFRIMIPAAESAKYL